MNFISLSYWFSARPGNLSSSGLKVMAVFLIILLIGAILAFVKKKQQGIYKNIWSDLIGYSITNLFLGGLLMFLFYESIPYLSARILGVIWLLLMAVWLYYILRKIKSIVEVREKRIKEQELKKYIP